MSGEARRTRTPLAAILIPQGLALAAMLALSASEGGYPLQHWAPAAVLTQLLLAVSLLALPGRRAPGALLPSLAIGGLALWTTASLLWSDDLGAAATSAARTAFLASAFVLLARWRLLPRSALVLSTGVTLAAGLFAWITFGQLSVTSDLDPWFLYDRLLEPVGYVNAGAALWAIVALIGVAHLGARVPLPVRLVGAATAVPGAALSFLCLSRGGIAAAAVVVALLLVLLPGRGRTLASIAVAALGFAVAYPQLSAVAGAVWTDPSLPPADGNAAVDAALRATVLGTLVALLATLAWGLAERSVAPGAGLRRLLDRGAAMLVAAGVLAAAALVLTNTGPLGIDRVRDRLETVTQPFQPTGPGDNRLAAGFSSGRWQFWEVAWQQFEREPLHGAGADQFRQDYLQSGATGEVPLYPHSLPLRMLGQLGIVGAALLLLWVIPSALAIRRLAASGEQAGRAVALAAAGALGIWLVHGSVDWLLAYGGLSAIVAGLAGLSVAAAGGVREGGGGDGSSRGFGAIGTLARLVGVVLLLAAGAWTSTQWLAERNTDVAARLAGPAPQQALQRARAAGAMELFGDRPDVLLGQLAIRRGDWAAARAAYLDAYAQNPRSVTTRRWLGVLASAEGDRRDALRWLRASLRVAPRDEISRVLLGQVDAGATIGPRAVAEILAERRAALTSDPDPPQ